MRENIILGLCTILMVTFLQIRTNNNSSQGGVVWALEGCAQPPVRAKPPTCAQPWEPSLNKITGQTGELCGR